MNPLTATNRILLANLIVTCVLVVAVGFLIYNQWQLTHWDYPDKCLDEFGLQTARVRAEAKITDSHDRLLAHLYAPDINILTPDDIEWLKIVRARQAEQRQVRQLSATSP